MLIFHQRYLHKVCPKTEGFFLSRFVCKELNPTQEHQAHTDIHTDQQSNVNRKEKKKILLLVIVFNIHFCYHSHNAYLDPDWEESHRFSPDA